MAEILQLYLVSFNDYYVKNLHSQIRRSTNIHDDAENFKKTQILKNTFDKTKQYLYTLSILEYLIKKTAVFLIRHFQKVFVIQGQSYLIEQKHYPLYKLAALDTIVDVKCLSAGFNTTHPPSPNNYDFCNKPLIANNYIYDGDVRLQEKNDEIDNIEKINEDALIEITMRK
ncbi:15352_t:CDS:2, partial [Racocetra fulgida]